MAASTLCADADTNAMRCLRRLAFKGDARVPSACAEAIMAGVTMNPRLKNQASRVMRMSRMLNEGGGSCATGNTCVANPVSSPQLHVQCNDVLNGCGACAQGTATIASGNSYIDFVLSSTTNPNNVACSNICCKAANDNRACCASSISNGGLSSAWCANSSQSFCNLT